MGCVKPKPRERVEVTASLQVSISKMETFFYDEEKEYQHGNLFDIVKFINGLDKAFAKEINESNRVSGFYKIDNDRLEYRSLPSTVNIFKVVEVLNEITKDY